MFVLDETALAAADSGGEWTRIVGELELLVKADDVLAMVGGRRHSRSLAGRLAEEAQAASDGNAASVRAYEGAGQELGFVLGVAAAVVHGWRGVGDADGAPLPFTPDRLQQLLRSNIQVYAAFDATVVLPLLIRSLEKNVSAPSPDSTSARAGKDTAGSARSRSAAKVATTPRTPRKPRSAPGSGKRSRTAKGKFD